MAWETITFSCGHTERVQMYGPHKDRERKAAWFEQSGLCSECLEKDREQQKIVIAVLAMAEQLGLATLAEGVETPGEHAMLAQLGCGDVQGFGIARPMPVDETLDWIARHRARVGAVPRIGHRAR